MHMEIFKKFLKVYLKKCLEGNIFLRLRQNALNQKDAKRAILHKFSMVNILKIFLMIIM